MISITILLFAFCVTINATPLPELKINDPNNITNYVTGGAIDSLESSESSNCKKCTDVSKVFFVMWTPENGPDNPLEFKAGVDPQELLNANFDPKRDTKFLSHGWTKKAKEFSKDYVEAFFNNPELNVNIIAVDYYELAPGKNYYRAAKNAVMVGKHAGQVIGVDLLLNGLGQNPEQIHAIGHSLGGHLVGHFGRVIKEQGGQGPIARISSLDPAGPYFGLPHVKLHDGPISKEDATLVDVMHTNSGFILEGQLSLPEPLGHVDFYPNGGELQTGCKSWCGRIICIKWNLLDMFLGACSHSRANDYYIESINAYKAREAFLSQECNSWEDFEDGKCTESKLAMGYGLDLNKYDYSIRKISNC